MRRGPRDRPAIVIAALGLLPALPFIMLLAASEPPPLLIMLWVVCPYLLTLICALLGDDRLRTMNTARRGWVLAVVLAGLPYHLYGLLAGGEGQMASLYAPFLQIPAAALAIVIILAKLAGARRRNSTRAGTAERISGNRNGGNQG